METLPIVERLGHVIKSSGDDRLYRAVRISQNQLEVLLVSDPETDKAAAAMDVNVGNFVDPKDIPGLSHFLEHMLFLGTSKYPDINEYQSFLSDHGGNSNAYTEAEHTNYYFEVNKGYLKEALDRFAQFFISPLFNRDATDRELNAVDSENDKNLQSDYWRLYQVLKSNAREDHPFHKFGTGSKHTLSDVPGENGVDVREELLKFHSKYYSANLMRLVVLGKESLDELEEWVVDMFSSIRNNNVPLPVVTSLPYASEALSKEFHIVPVKNLMNLCLYWQLPSTFSLYKLKPTFLLAHLLGHEGKGSILAFLKAKGWANDLSAGVSESTSGFSIFSVSISFTEEGLEVYQQVIRVVFAYLHRMLLSDESTWRLIFDEVSSINAMNFKFKSKEEPSSYCSSVSKNLQLYGIEDCLCGPWLMSEFSFDSMRQFIECLLPENSFAFVISPHFDGSTNLVEKWYSTNYSCKYYNEDVFVPFYSDELSLPSVNAFIASDFSLCCEKERKNPSEVPIKCLSSSVFDLWHKMDTHFKKPKTNVFCLFTSPETCSSPQNMVINHLFCGILQDALGELTYDAEIAGLSYALDVMSIGMTLFVKGYSEKLPVLLECILKKVKRLSVDQNRFESIREQLSRSFSNFFHDSPYKHAFYYTSMCLHDGRWHKRDYLDVIDNITKEQVESFGFRFLQNARLKTLIHGNITRVQAIKLNHSIVSSIDLVPLVDGQLPQPRVVQLKPGVDYVYQERVDNHEEKNSATLVVLQIGENSIRNGVLLELLHQIISEPCFSQLRTVEQLGYIVGCLVDNQRGIASLKIIVQSSVKGPVYLEERIHCFLSEFENALGKMTKDEFVKHISLLKANILEKDKSLDEESSRIFQEITKEKVDFDRKEREAEEVDKLNHEDLVSFYAKCISPKSKERKKLSIQVFGFDEEVPSVDQLGDFVELIDDFVAFRRSQGLYPCFV